MITTSKEYIEDGNYTNTGIPEAESQCSKTQSESYEEGTIGTVSENKHLAQTLAKQRQRRSYRNTESPNLQECNYQMKDQLTIEKSTNDSHLRLDSLKRRPPDIQSLSSEMIQSGKRRSI